MPRHASRRCILVFARDPLHEERAKRLPGGRRVFRQAATRLSRAAAELPEVDLVFVGDSFAGDGADVGPRARPVATACTEGVEASSSQGARPRHSGDYVAGSATPRGGMDWCPNAADIPGRALSLHQRGRTFGERLRHALTDVAALGYGAAVVVPIDVPQLDVGTLRQALDALEQGSTVLGPSPDGGVYLIGCPTAGGERFAGVPWCTGRVFSELLRRLPRSRILRPLADLDGIGDVRAVLGAADLDPALAVLLAALVVADDRPETPPAVLPRRAPVALSRRGRAPPALAA